jgi:YD repeat-containing protein
MKGYGQGEDNVTHQEMTSNAPGYAEMLDTKYFGGGFSDGREPGGNWERFWIVPAEVTRCRAATGKLTLFDVPLKVRTKKMVLRKGELEDDPNGKSSKGAMAFIEWFTRNYEGIAEEQYLQPPPESGLTEPVPIYSELRRIALTTAIAEQLRDQGVPLPFWMRNYPVKRIPVTPTTPSLTTARQKGNAITRIFGGVNLSPADSAVKNVDTPADAARLPPGQHEAAVQAVAAANALAPAVAEATAMRPPLTPVVVSTPEKAVTAVSMPGAESMALAPCRLQEEDLVATGDNGVRLSLARHFNSFFQPDGELGKGWTLDLPQLVLGWIPTKRTDFGSERSGVPELITPLNSVYARFSRIAEIPELNNVRLYVPDKPGPILAKAAADNPLVPEAKSKVIFRDGRSWFFDDKERFVAEQMKPVTTVYRRDEVGRLVRIAGYDGDRETAAIRLEYDGEGRVKKVASVRAKPTPPHVEEQKPRSFFGKVFGGHHKAEPEPVAQDEELPDLAATFAYDEKGMLASVNTPDGRVSYTYENGLVVGVTRAPKGADAQAVARTFEYAANGQLTAEVTPDGTRIDYSVRQHEGKRHLNIGTKDANVAAEYDAANRPLAMTEEDGTKTTWHYGEEGAIAAETTLPSGESLRMSLGRDKKGRQVRTTTAADGPLVREQLDDAGRTVRLSVEKTPTVGKDARAAAVGAESPMEDVLTQEWRPDGLLGSLDFKTHAIVPEYDEHGRVKGVNWARWADAEHKEFSVLQKVRFDASGRLSEVKDCHNGNVGIGYDKDGNIANLTTTRVIDKDKSEQLAYAFTRDEHGRITGLHSPGGQETCTYDASGDPSTVLVKRGQAEARIEFSEGQPRRVTQFDGGRVEFDYEGEGPAKGQLKEVRTPAIDLRYAYDDTGALAEVACGDACRVVYGYDTNGNLASLEYVPAAGKTAAA